MLNRLHGLRIRSVHRTAADPRAGQSGITLVEIVIGIAIVAMVSVFAVPALRLWIQNTQVRTMAESIHAGLQLARTEAVRRNASMRFQFVTTDTNSCALSTSAANWVVSERDPTARCATAPTDLESPVTTTNPRIKQFRMGTDGSRSASVSATSALVTFSSLGQAAPANTINISAPSAGTCVDAGGDIRCMRVVVTVGGQTRMCDPARTSTVANPDPQAC